MTDPVPSKDQLADLITQVLGERCADYDANCMTCRAWQMLDALRGVASCSTCEACRGAATLALGGSAPSPLERLQRSFTAEEARAYKAFITDFFEAPHCSTCGCGLAPEPAADFLADAERIVADYARRNPKWADLNGVVQDPWGAHAWLERYRASKPPEVAR